MINFKQKIKEEDLCREVGFFAYKGIPYSGSVYMGLFQGNKNYNIYMKGKKIGVYQEKQNGKLLIDSVNIDLSLLKELIEY